MAERLDDEQQQDVLAAGVPRERRTATQICEGGLELAEHAQGAAVHPERGQPCRLLIGGQALQRGGRLLERAAGVAAVRGDRCDRAAGQRGQLEHGVAERPGVVARIARLRPRLGEVAGQERRQAQREPQPDAIGRRLRRQVAERDLQPAPGGLVAARATTRRWRARR